MRILQLMKWLSPREDTGGKIRACRIGRALSTFAKVDTAGFVPPGERVDGTEEHLSHYGRLFPFPAGRGVWMLRDTLAAFAGGLSLRSARFYSSKFKSFVEKILLENRYDALQVEELPLMAALDGLNPGIPLVFSAHNVESELSPRLFRRRNPLFRLLADLERRRTAKEERQAADRARACLVVSEGDRQAVKRLGTRSPIHILPNCAQDRFRPPDSGFKGQGLLAVGAFGWYPNVEGFLWFVDDVWPLIRKRTPGAVLRVAGSGITRSFRRKMERRGIEVHGDVPDILPFLQGARLLVVPLRIGGGTRIKIVEAWAAGLPVVSTAQGAEGLPVRPGTDILIAADGAAFAAAVGRVLDDDGLCGKLRSEGLKNARKYRWSRLAPSLEAVYRDILERGGTDRS